MQRGDMQNTVWLVFACLLTYKKIKQKKDNIKLSSSLLFITHFPSWKLFLKTCLYFIIYNFELLNILMQLKTCMKLQSPRICVPVW